MSRITFSETIRVGKAKTLAFGVALTVALLLGLLAAKPAHAVTFTVDSTGDDSDTDLSDNVCIGISTGQGTGLCTLRAAIEQANATPGVDTINFNIDLNTCPQPRAPAITVCTMAPASRLPAITEAVTIDGYSQPGTSKNTRNNRSDDAVLRIELNGSNVRKLAPTDGLDVNTSNVVIKGLVINGFDGSGIRISGSDNRVEGNFIGTDAQATCDICSDLGNGESGVNIASGSNNHIGGLPSSGSGAYEATNVISNNKGAGVEIQTSATGNTVEANLIGTKKDGLNNPKGNSLSGVLIDGASNNTVGNASSAAGNVIAYNLEDGVTVTGSSSTANRILGNSVSSNSRLGIDLNGDGRTPNDPKDPDTGPNNLQNFPIISSVAAPPGSPVTIKGTLNSTRRKTFTIQFFSNVAGDPEGESFLGETTVKTNRRGKASFTFVLPSGMGLPKGEPSVTATATNNATGDTSEFSDPKAIT